MAGLSPLLYISQMICSRCLTSSCRCLTHQFVGETNSADVCADGCSIRQHLFFVNGADARREVPVERQQDHLQAVMLSIVLKIRLLTLWVIKQAGELGVLP